jgi:hypothetical protein
LKSRFRTSGGSLWIVIAPSYTSQCKLKIYYKNSFGLANEKNIL